MLTQQLIFSKVWNGMKSQGFRRALYKGQPQYRAGDCRCPIGHLIQDFVYSEILEGFAVGPDHDRHSPAMKALAESGIDVKDYAIITLCSLLQKAHDTWSSDSKTMEAQLRYVASQRGLTIPE